MKEVEKRVEEAMKKFSLSEKGEIKEATMCEELARQNEKRKKAGKKRGGRAKYERVPTRM